MRRVRLAAAFFALVLVFCVTEDKKVEPGASVTRSTEEFRMKYPDLNPVYYGRVVEAESIAEQGKRLYDEYYRKKNEEKVKDRELAVQGRQVLQKAIDIVYVELYKETEAQSLLNLYLDISRFAKDLARELEPELGEEKPAPEEKE